MSPVQYRVLMCMLVPQHQPAIAPDFFAIGRARSPRSCLMQSLAFRANESLTPVKNLGPGSIAGYWTEGKKHVVWGSRGDENIEDHQKIAPRMSMGVCHVVLCVCQPMGYRRIAKASSMMQSLRRISLAGCPFGKRNPGEVWWRVVKLEPSRSLSRLAE